MKKLLLASVLTLSFPCVALTAPKQSNTTMIIDYENVQQLIKNQYAAQEVCRSGRETTEVMIMCDYSVAAERKLEQLGYCGSYEDKPVSEWKWHKCSEKEKSMYHNP